MMKDKIIKKDMRTFLVSWDTCFSIINAESKEELFESIKGIDKNFNLKNGKIHYKWDDTYNEKVEIEDLTDKKGEVFGGCFG